MNTQISRKLNTLLNIPFEPKSLAFIASQKMVETDPINKNPVNLNPSKCLRLKTCNNSLFLSV